jgi:hypothetical protein
MAATVVVANVCLYMGDKFLLVAGSDHCVTTGAGQANGHAVSFEGG